jgi:glycosyltransferase involved in cell wall biosynthesis
MSKVSIGLPCFNEAPFIEATLRSVLSQSEDDFEFIICDNASTDGTLEIIQSVAGSDPRVIIHANPTNIGGPANFARSWELATCPYFMWMGAHDLIEKDYVKKLRMVLDSDPQCSLAYSDSILIAKDGSEIPGELAETGVAASDDSVVHRFKKLVWELHRCDLFHGLTRRTYVNPLHLTAGRAPDMVILADFVLRGKFRRVPEIMFRRRHNREPEDIEAWQKRLTEQGYVSASQTEIDSWTGTRDAHLAILDRADITPNQRQEMRMAVCQAYLEKHSVPWDASTEAATAWERFLLRISSESRREEIRQTIRAKAAYKARFDNASARARIQKELINLLKENHRLRRELAKARKK